MTPAMPTPKKQYGQRRRVKVKAEQGYVQRRQPDTDNHLKLRAICVMGVLTLCFSAIGTKLGHVALAPPQEPRTSVHRIPQQPTIRGNILDANGTIIATSLKVHSIYADPQRILNPQETAAKLANVLPHTDVSQLASRLSRQNRRFIWIERHVTPAQAFAVNGLGLPGVGFREEYVRMYPHKRLAAHVVGATNIDGKGLAGIERSYNTHLKQGKDVQLTLDMRLQHQLTEALRTTYADSEAKSAWGLALDARTGAIRAMASLPDFNPNNYGQARQQSKFNPVTFGRYEMGSTFKLFTLAQGLAEGHITPETVIDARKPITIGKYTIRDYHAKKRELTALEVLRYSSNIGAAKIAEMFGQEAQKQFFYDLGLLSPLNIHLPETVAPDYPPIWRKVHLYTAAFGHGIAVTPVHMAAATAVLSTDGQYRTPHVVKNRDLPPPRPVIDTAAVEQVKTLMEDVVQNGSGRRAQVAGLHIGGKTGTAEKVGVGGYSEDKNLVSFIATVPLDDPQLILLVMVNEPKHGYHTGGLAAAPAVQQLVKRAAPLLQMAPTPPTKEDITHVAYGPAE